jgi:hypothetical protein
MIDREDARGAGADVDAFWRVPSLSESLAHLIAGLEGATSNGSGHPALSDQIEEARALRGRILRMEAEGDGRFAAERRARDEAEERLETLEARVAALDASLARARRLVEEAEAGRAAANRELEEHRARASHEPVAPPPPPELAQAERDLAAERRTRHSAEARAAALEGQLASLARGRSEPVAAPPPEAPTAPAAAPVPETLPADLASAARRSASTMALPASTMPRPDRTAAPPAARAPARYGPGRVELLRRRIVENAPTILLVLVLLVVAAALGWLVANY